MHGAVLGVDVEVVKRSDVRPGFAVVRKRWIVEQVYGTLMLHRRLVREYESRPEPSVSQTLWSLLSLEASHSVVEKTQLRWPLAANRLLRAAVQDDLYDLLLARLDLDLPPDSIQPVVDHFVAKAVAEWEAEPTNQLPGTPQPNQS